MVKIKIRPKMKKSTLIGISINYESFLIVKYQSSIFYH